MNGRIADKPDSSRVMTPKEIEEYLDIHLFKVITNLKQEAEGTNPTDLAGAITGFLLNSGVALAASGGCPKHVLEAAMVEAIRKAYKL